MKTSTQDRIKWVYPSVDCWLTQSHYSLVISMSIVRSNIGLPSSSNCHSKIMVFYQIQLIKESCYTSQVSSFQCCCKCTFCFIFLPSSWDEEKNHTKDRQIIWLSILHHHLHFRDHSPRIYYVFWITWASFLGRTLLHMK